MTKLKFPLWKYVARHCYLFLASAVLIPMIVNYISKVKTDPKDFEIFSITMTADFVDGKASEFKEKLSKQLSDDILEFNLYCYSTTTTSTSDYEYHFKHSDLVISPSMLSGVTTDYFVEVPPDLQKDSDEIKDGKHWGVKVSDVTSGSRLNEEYISSYGTEDSYIYIRSSSLHVKDDNDVTYRVLRSFLGYAI